ncbi:hypothetical protein [Geodermatophilus sp. URMC 60]
MEAGRAADAAAVLDQGAEGLLRRAGSAVTAEERPPPAVLLGKDGDTGDEGMDHGGGHEGMDHGGGHEGMDHGGGHEGMDHMHHGGEVAGLPMAMTGPDRDGLQLDVLTVSLGPILPGWPTGLVLRGEVRGDVLTGVDLSWLDAEDHVPASSLPDARQTALDHLARFLLVAGWPTAARDARRARDGLRSEDRGQQVAAQRLAEQVSRRVLRSRALHWGIAGAGRPARDGDASSADLVLGRLHHWCDVAAGRDGEPDTAPALEDIRARLEGCEIGTARLIVAALGVDPVTSPGAVEPARA